jgi:hypothetical protein
VGSLQFVPPSASDDGERDDAEVVEDPDTDEALDEADIGAEADEDAGDGHDADAGEAAAKTSNTSAARASRSAPRSRSKAADALADKRKAEAIRQVDQLERRIGYLGALLTVVIGLVAFAPYISDPKKRVSDQFKRVGNHCPKGFKDTVVNGVHQCTGTVTFPRSHWITELAIVILFAIFIGVATWYGRRSLVAFSLLFGGLAIVSTTGSILGIVYVGAGGWLMVRAYRVQKYGTTSGKEVAAKVAEQRAERKAAAGKSGTSSRTSSRTSSGGSKGKGKKAAPTNERSKPQANKRYTPKTPPRKRPVPPSD